MCDVCLQGGWQGTTFQGLRRFFFRFSDSHVTGAVMHSASSDDAPVDLDFSIAHFAGILLIRDQTLSPTPSLHLGVAAAAAPQPPTPHSLEGDLKAMQFASPVKPPAIATSQGERSVVHDSWTPRHGPPMAATLDSAGPLPPRTATPKLEPHPNAHTHRHAGPNMAPSQHTPQPPTPYGMPPQGMVRHLSGQLEGQRPPQPYQHAEHMQQPHHQQQRPPGPQYAPPTEHYGHVVPSPSPGLQHQRRRPPQPQQQGGGFLDGVGNMLQQLLPMPDRPPQHSQGQQDRRVLL
mmetsp:Transcript_35033/g.81789  ORF Transcript_35033/g.81789 Transcript_35033/m.81789 type:complete len:290 (-) Transcript_35033:35-904(-)